MKAQTKLTQQKTKKMKLYLSQINTAVGDLEGNTAKILRELQEAEKQNCDLIIFHEAAVTGYPCQDLWQKKYFLQEARQKIDEIIAATKGLKCAVLVGCPLIAIGRAKKEVVYNSALLIENGVIKNIINKKTLPNYGVFDEARYFENSPSLSFVEFCGQTLAILICEDLWDAKNLYLLQEQIFDCVIAINSSPYSINKHGYRQQITQKFVQALKKPLIYLNQVGGQDSLVFDGDSFVLNESGQTVLNLKKFAEDSAVIDLNKGSVASHHKILPQQDLQQSSFADKNSDICKNNYSACVLGLRDYIRKNNFSQVLLGMSGGIDSALVAAISVDALGAENVKICALPTRFNSEASMFDAKECAKNLGLNLEVISIEKVFATMISTLYDYCGSSSTSKASDLARENLQSRIRGNILMAISNSTGALLLSTGNKSELATGYATLYGDMCGAFNPIKDLYKTQIYDLVKWRNSNIPELFCYQKTNIIPQSIIIKEPTAELRENQKDSDSLPSYEILDKILFALIEEQKSVFEIIKSGFSEDLVKKVAKLFYSSEYKRAQSVIGPKISDMAFDKDRRYPMTNKFWK